MKCVFDTNILISALLSENAPPAHLLDLWLERAFTLVSAEVQLSEVRRVSRYPKLKGRLKPHAVGGLINRIRDKAELVEPVTLDVSPDPDDNLILGIAVAARANVLVTGDKSHLLALETVDGVSILSTRAFLKSF